MAQLFPYLRGEDDLRPAPIIPVQDAYGTASEPNVTPAPVGSPDTPPATSPEQPADGQVPGKAEYNVTIPPDDSAAPTTTPAQPTDASVGNTVEPEPATPAASTGTPVEREANAPGVEPQRHAPVGAGGVDYEIAKTHDANYGQQATADAAAGRYDPLPDQPAGTELGSGRATPDTPSIDAGPTPAPPPRRDKKGRPIDAKGRAIQPTWEEYHAKYGYKDPYSNPQTETEVRENEHARLLETIKHPMNEDHGVKGRIKEIAQNFLAGMAQTPQGASIGQALLLGGAGAGAGLFNRGLNEQRQAERDLPGAERNLAVASALDAHRATIKNQQNEILNRDLARTQHATEIGNAENKNLRDTYHNIWKDLSGKGGYQKGADPRLDTILERLFPESGGLPEYKDKPPNLQLHDRKSGEEVTFNPETGETKSLGTFAAPTSIKDNQLDDSLFPFLGPEPKDTSAEERKARTNGEALQREAADYEQQAAQFTSNLDKDKKMALLAKAAAAREQGNKFVQQGNEIRDAAAGTPEQKSLRAEVANFRLAVTNHRPKAGAQVVPINELVQTFNGIMAIKDPKVRADRLEKFYKQALPNIDIR